MELYRAPAEYFYGRCLFTDSRWATPPGYVTEGTMRAGMQSQVGRAASLAARAEARDATHMEDIVERGYVIIGSPDEVVEQLTEVATSLNVGHLMFLLQYGNMGKELTKYNTKLFAEKVLPRLHPLFSEWEDRWWPQPMEVRSAPKCRPSCHALPRSEVRTSHRLRNLPSPPLGAERVSVRWGPSPTHTARGLEKLRRLT